MVGLLIYSVFSHCYQKLIRRQLTNSDQHKTICETKFEHIKKMIKDKARPFTLKDFYKLKVGIGKLA